MAIDLDALIAELEPVLRDEIRKDYPAPSCIESCRILAGLLQDVGIHAWAFPVVACVANAPYAERQAVEGLLTDWGTLGRWHRDSEAFLVRIGWGEWPGHLVLLTEGPDGIALWDPSINQADIPAYHLALPKLAVLTPIDPAFVAGSVTVASKLPDGTLLIYEAQPARVPRCRPAGGWPVMDEALVSHVETRIRACLQQQAGYWAGMRDTTEGRQPWA